MMQVGWLSTIVLVTLGQSAPSAQAPELIAQQAAKRKLLEHAPLGRYLEQALTHSPRLKAAHSGWKSQLHAVAPAARLPKPELRFAYFIQSIETRVGPQRAKLGLNQPLPWPTRLWDREESAEQRAAAAYQKLEFEALQIVAGVSKAYWALWLLRRSRRIHQDHLQLLKSLAEALSARVATGPASLAEYQQLNLSIARLEDMLVQMGQDEVTLAAQFRARSGLRKLKAIETSSTAPTVFNYPLQFEALAERLQAHPRLRFFRRLEAAEEARKQALEGERLPELSLGMDWIITDSSPTAGIDNGKDALSVGLMLKLPLWQGNYLESVTSAQHRKEQLKAQHQAALEQALAELQTALSAVKNASRRIQLHRRQLLPQASTVYVSVQGQFSAGRGSMAQVLWAQKDLLELNIELAKAYANYASGWTELESILGQPLATTTISDWTNP